MVVNPSVPAKTVPDFIAYRVCTRGRAAEGRSSSRIWSADSAGPVLRQTVNLCGSESC